MRHSCVKANSMWVDVAGGAVDHEAFGGVALEEHGGILFEGTAGRMVCAAVL